MLLVSFSVWVGGRLRVVCYFCLVKLNFVIADYNLRVIDPLLSSNLSLIFDLNILLLTDPSLLFGFNMALHLFLLLVLSVCSS